MAAFIRCLLTFRSNFDANSHAIDPDSDSNSNYSSDNYYNSTSDPNTDLRFDSPT